jgi:Zn-finger nucleic acid-binding protein
MNTRQELNKLVEKYDGWFSDTWPNTAEFPSVSHKEQFEREVREQNEQIAKHGVTRAVQRSLQTAV